MDSLQTTSCAASCSWVSLIALLTLSFSSSFIYLYSKYWSLPRAQRCGFHSDPYSHGPCTLSAKVLSRKQ